MSAAKPRAGRHRPNARGSRRPLTDEPGSPADGDEGRNESGKQRAVQARTTAIRRPCGLALSLTLEPNVPHALLVCGVNGATGLGLLEILELP